MLPYFYVTGFIAFMALVSPARRIHPYMWALAFLVVLLFVGLRHHVGMDWNNYLRMIEDVNKGSLPDALGIAEPGYATLLWLSGQLGWGVYGSNFAGTLIFCMGLFRYARKTPYPWVALLVAMPFLVIVIGMSANRQAVAIGVLLWVIAGWTGNGIFKRAIGVGVAALFHFSAMFFVVFLVADLKLRRTIKYAIAGIFIATAVYVMFATGQAEYYDSSYGSGQTTLTKSEGAIFHVLFNGGPALLYFFLPLKKRRILFPDTLHKQMAFLAIALLPMAFVASTAAARVSLYLFPVSMYVISAFPLLFEGARSRTLMRYGVGISMLLVQYVWLRFANSSKAHLPYENFLTVPEHLWKLCC